MSVAKAVRERPILFSGEMVRAILEGRKTQTRRIINPQPASGVRREVFSKTGFSDGHGRTLRTPYVPAELLWVRETFVLESSREYGSEGYPPPFNDGRPVNWVEDEDWGRYWEQPHYRATDPVPELAYDDTNEPTCRWGSPIHMPRWASRITLEITEVRVQRLQAVSPDDVLAEGMRPNAGGGWGPEGRLGSVPGFADLWDSINAKRAPWSSNPWVWAITFKAWGVTAP